jgi:hypothetical protein
VSATYLVPIVIEPIHDGVYGYRTEATIPAIARGAGIPISGHLGSANAGTTAAGTSAMSNARCETGKVEATGQFTFDEGTRAAATFIKPCTAIP